MNEINIRPVGFADNKILASIIRDALLEFNAAKPGTVYFDKTTDHLYELFREKNSCYFVAEKNGQILGGSGIFPTAGLPADTCELVKLYLHKEARGVGLGKKLMATCLDKAKEMGYKFVYLETMPELNIAVPMYQKLGFEFLSSPMGNSGHGGCNIWMGKTL